MKIIITENQLRSLTRSLLNEASKYDVLIKLGFNPEQSKILDDIAGKLSLFFMNKLKDKYDKNITQEQWAELVNKDKIFDKERNNIQYILDWFKGGLNGNFKQFEKLSFDDLYKKSDEWHDSLKAEGGDYNYDEQGDIIIDYRNNGIGYYWVNLDKSDCKIESKRMGHCGSGRGTLYSLRSVKKINDETTVNDSHLTADISEDGRINQLRGKNNSKPADKYSNYIFDLLTFKEPNGEYLIKEIPEVDSRNFSLSDFNNKLLIDLFNQRPEVYKNYIERNNDGEIILDYGNGIYWVKIYSEYTLKFQKKINEDIFIYKNELKIYNKGDYQTIEGAKNPFEKYGKYILDLFKSKNNNGNYRFQHLFSDDTIQNLNLQNLENFFIENQESYANYLLSSGSGYLSNLLIKKLPDNIIIFDGILDIENTPITSLSNLKSVGSLHLTDSPIENLNPLVQVDNYLNLTNSKIKYLGDLEYVGKDLILKNTPIINLGKLEEVGQNLNIENTSIISLDNLMEVGGNILIKGSELAKRYSIQQLEEMYPQFKGKFVI